MCLPCRKQYLSPAYGTGGAWQECWPGLEVGAWAWAMVAESEIV